MDEESNLGLNKLARVMQQRMNRNQDANGALVLDFGTIQKDMSLKTNTFAVPIPQKDYHVLRQLTLGKTGDILAKTQNIGAPGSGEHQHEIIKLQDSRAGKVTGTVGIPASPAPDPPNPPQSSAGGGGTEGAHQHHVLIPEKMRSIAPGDRVLVAWVQSEAVVIDIILPATSV